MSDQISIPAVYMRGGTSRAIVFQRASLPASRDDWAPLLCAALGSPDGNGRQLDGMGGGISSLSKICVVAPSQELGVDIDYTFVQVMVGEAKVDFKANCGNMASAMGPFAVDEGLVEAPADGEVTVRIRNTNTGKRIDSTFAVRGGRAVVQGGHRIDGVAGSGAPVRLDFLDPGGAATGRLLPTGNVRDTVDLPGREAIAYSFVDAGNPCMFVDMAALGLSGVPSPAEIERDPGLLALLDLLRRHGSVAGGAASDLEAARDTSVPRIVMVARAQDTVTSAGETVKARDADIVVRAISRGRPHRAVQITGALCLATACALPGSVPHALLEPGADPTRLRIAHPSGVATVAARMRPGGDVESASIFLTARRLFQGEVLVRRSLAQGVRLPGRADTQPS